METTANSTPYQVNDYGSIDDWSKFSLFHPKLGSIPGKQFLRSALGLTGIEVSLNSLAPHQEIPYSHGHRKNEELYLFLTGKGQMLLDGNVVEVKAGTAVRVSPPVLRSWRNTGNEPLVSICIQAGEGTLLQATQADGFIGDVAPIWPA